MDLIKKIQKICAVEYIQNKDGIINKILDILRELALLHDNERGEIHKIIDEYNNEIKKQEVISECKKVIQNVKLDHEKRNVLTVEKNEPKGLTDSSEIMSFNIEHKPEDKIDETDEKVYVVKGDINEVIDSVVQKYRTYRPVKIVKPEIKDVRELKNRIKEMKRNRIINLKRDE